MGIDCYIRAKDQTEAERDAQITGFDITKGDVGYLRESIGGIHAVTWLFPEAFADEEGSLENARRWYSSGGEYQMASTITDLMTKASGAAPGMTFEGPDLGVAAGGFPPDGYCVEAEIVSVPETWENQDGTMETWNEVSFRIPVDVLRRRLPLVEALARQRYTPTDGSDNKGRDPRIEKVVRSYRSFVDVYEALEAEGRDPSIYVSY